MKIRVKTINKVMRLFGFVLVVCVPDDEDSYTSLEVIRNNTFLKRIKEMDNESEA